MLIILHILRDYGIEDQDSRIDEITTDTVSLYTHGPHRGILIVAPVNPAV